MTIPTTDMTKVRALLALALSETHAATPYRPEDNPLTHLSLRDLQYGKGVRGFADQYPAIIKADTTVAANIEAVRRTGLADGRVDKSNQRRAAARARAARKQQIDALVESPVVPDRLRLEMAWAVVMPLSEIVDKIALGKRAWAARFLGTMADDIGQVAIEKMVLALAKDTKDLTVLRTSAEQLAGIAKRTGITPGDQVTDAERKENRQVAKGRKWLMGMVNNRVMGALVDAYTSQRNLRWENLDLIATVMASINGAGDDPMIAATKASKAPSMIGSRMPRPGSFDPNWLALAIGAGITDRKLDRLTELLLDETRRTTNGAFRWTDNAEAVFLASPNGANKWSMVLTATAKAADPAQARARLARMHTRNLFTWMPSVIMAIIDAFDWEAVERVYVKGNQYALMSSPFERVQDKAPAGLTAKRYPLRPALTFATAQEAAIALTRYLTVIVDGAQVDASLAQA